MSRLTRPKWTQQAPRDGGRVVDESKSATHPQPLHPAENVSGDESIEAAIEPASPVPIGQLVARPGRPADERLAGEPGVVSAVQPLSVEEKRAGGHRGAVLGGLDQLWIEPLGRCRYGSTGFHFGRYSGLVIFDRCSIACPDCARFPRSFRSVNECVEAWEGRPSRTG